MGWDDERIKMAVALFNGGMPCSEIARRLGGVSRNAVLGKLYRMGHTRGLSPSQAARSGSRQKKRRKAPWTAKSNPELEAIRTKAALAEYEAIRSRPDLDVPPHERKTILVKDKHGRLCANDALDQHSCRWSLTDTSPFEFCGRAAVPGTSWCEFHLRRVASPPALAVRLGKAETAAHHARVKEAA